MFEREGGHAVGEGHPAVGAAHTLRAVPAQGHGEFPLFVFISGGAGHGLTDSQAACILHICHLYRAGAGKEGSDVLISQIRFRRIQLPMMIHALLDAQPSPAFIHTQGDRAVRNTGAVFQYFVGRTVTQMQGVVPAFFVYCTPFDAVLHFLAGLEHGLDVVEGGIHVVIHDKLQHALEDRPHAPEYGDAVVFAPCVGVDASVVYDDFDDLITLHISIRRTCLYQIVSAVYQILFRSKNRAASQFGLRQFFHGSHGFVR